MMVWLEDDFPLKRGETLRFQPLIFGGVFNEGTTVNISPSPNGGTFESMMIFLFLMVGDVRFLKGIQ